MRAPLLALLALSLALAAAGCGSTASPSPAATSGPTPSPIATETPEPTEAASPTGDQAGDGPDLSGAAGALEDLDSYQMDVRIEGTLPGASGFDGTVTVQLVVDRANDALQMSMTGVEGLPATGLNVIVIGEDAWVDLGTGTYIQQPGGAGGFAGSMDAFAPAVLLQSANAEDLEGLEEIGQETKNGVETTHYRVDAATNPDLAEEIGEDGVVEVWLANDGGYLVSMSFSGTVDADGTPSEVEMTIDISRLNDPSIDIQPPN